MRQFVVSFIDHHQKDLSEVAHSIELLSHQMASFQREMNARFESVQKEMNARFETVDKRFEDLIHYMDKRFNSLQWFIVIGVTMLALLITILTFLVK